MKKKIKLTMHLATYKYSRQTASHSQQHVKNTYPIFFGAMMLLSEGKYAGRDIESRLTGCHLGG